MAKTRERPVYKVTITESTGEVKTRIVRADNPAQARGHVVRDVIGVARAASDDLVAAGRDGIAIEEASAE